MIVFARWMFALLLLANIVFFAVMQLPKSPSGLDSASAHTPLHAEKIRLLQEADLPAAAPAQPEAPARICLEWGTFSPQTLVRAQTAMQALKLDEHAITLRDAPEKASKYWVYIPPLKTKAEALKKLDELKNTGLEDGFIMQDDNKWHFAISLGVFSTQEAANNYLSQLRTKGVKSAKAGPHSLGNQPVSMLIKASGANVEADLVKMKQDFPGTELKAIACAF